MITRRTATAGLAISLAGLIHPESGGAASGGGETIAAHDLTGAPARAMLGADGRGTTVWAFNGALAPVLRMKQGAELRLVLKNDTALPLTLHLHGMRGPNAMDGVGGLVQAPVLPGESFAYRLTPPDAGTYLIRPCIPGGSREPLARGLSGLLIVEEENPPALDRDEPVLVDDWLVAEDGGLAPFTPDSMGRLGNRLTVNGQAIPKIIEAPPGSRIRLRFANACNARIMRLGFESLKPFVAAIDGQPTDTFEPLRASLPFAPGTRYDVLIDMPDEKGSVSALIGNGIPLVELRPVGAPAQERAAIARLPANPRLPARIKLQNASRRDLVIEAGAQGAASPWSINGTAGDLKTPLIKVRRGSPVVLALINRTGMAQPFHLHGHAFRLLHGLDDGWEPYFLDTLQAPEMKTARIAFVADNPGKWLLASTIMERFDAGLWTWIEVS